MSLRGTLGQLWQHPLARRERGRTLLRWLRWQLISRLGGDATFAMPWVNGSRLWIRRGLTGATGNLYCGLHEWPDMAFVLHLLRPGDVFADIGANVGSYTVLASAAVGATTVAYEPVPESYAWLCRNVELNAMADRVHLHRRAIGARQGIVRFSVDRGPMNRVVDAGYAGASEAIAMVPVDGEPMLRSACCWKLDVEGHEGEVLAGAADTLAAAPPCTLLCEDRSPSVQEALRRAGFLPCGYDPWRRKLMVDVEVPGSNMIWVRDPAWAQERLRRAPPFHVLGRAI